MGNACPYPGRRRAELRRGFHSRIDFFRQPALHGFAAQGCDGCD